MDSTFLSYLRAFTVRWFVFMSGPLSVPLAIIAYFVQNDAAKVGLFATALVCAVFASYWIWKIEREARIECEKTNQSAAQIDSESYPDLRIADCAEVLELFKKNDARLIGLLTAGRLSSWARQMQMGKKLLPLEAIIWNTHQFHFYPALTDEQNTINQTFLRCKKESTHYDVCMNVAQIKRLWPELHYLKLNEMKL